MGQVDCSSNVVPSYFPSFLFSFIEVGASEDGSAFRDAQLGSLSLRMRFWGASLWGAGEKERGWKANRKALGKTIDFG